MQGYVFNLQHHTYKPNQQGGRQGGREGRGRRERRGREGGGRTLTRKMRKVGRERKRNTEVRERRSKL